MIELPTDFLSRIYHLAETNRHREASAEVMDELGGLLLSGNVSRCDEVMAAVDVNRLVKRPTVLIAFLGITVAASNSLKNRSGLWERIHSALQLEIGPERTSDILERFRQMEPLGTGLLAGIA